MHVAFVVQRYGPSIAGGAERLCRETARALAGAGHRVTVLTTTADDVATWAPVFPDGAGLDGQVMVERFTACAADPTRAARLLRGLAVGRGDAAAESAWVTAHGPVSPRLLSRVASCDADLVVLWTYLFATTQLSIPLVAPRSILVPTAHDEPMLRFGVTRGVMALAGGFAFLTPEEQGLVADYHHIADRPAEVVGAGLAASQGGDSRRLRARHPELPARFALYLGRKDLGKGLGELVSAHRSYRSHGGAFGLVLAGPGPSIDGEIDLGYVDDDTRADLLAACELLVLPSAKESLSLVLLEAWQAGRPTLANAWSAAAAGQTRRSGGGLQYAGKEDYVRQLGRLERDDALRAKLASHGRAWVATHTWPAAVARWERLFDRVLGRRPSVSEASG